MLKGENIFLRAIEPEDVDLLYDWENNTENWKVSNTLVPFSKHTLLQYVNSPQDIFLSNQIRFMICLNQIKIPIGTIDLFEYDAINSRAGVGILINDKSQRSKGLASESLELLINYCSNQLKLRNLFCNIAASNQISIKLFKKHKFNLVGVKKNWNRIYSGWEDELFYQLEL